MDVPHLAPLLLLALIVAVTGHEIVKREDGTEGVTCRYEDSIPGTPEQDYPIFNDVPQTNFLCTSQEFAGYYGDEEARCQVFHICQFDGRQDSFLCPNGSLFDQRYFVCNWWFNVDCSKTSSFYSLNAELFPDAPGPNIQQTLGGSRDPLQAGSLPVPGVIGGGSVIPASGNDFSGFTDVGTNGLSSSSNLIGGSALSRPPKPSYGEEDTSGQSLEPQPQIPDIDYRTLTTVQPPLTETLTWAPPPPPPPAPRPIPAPRPAPIPRPASAPRTPPAPRPAPVPRPPPASRPAPSQQSPPSAPRPVPAPQRVPVPRPAPVPRPSPVPQPSPGPAFPRQPDTRPSPSFPTIPRPVPRPNDAFSQTGQGSVLRRPPSAPAQYPAEDDQQGKFQDVAAPAPDVQENFDNYPVETPPYEQESQNAQDFQDYQNVAPAPFPALEAEPQDFEDYQGQALAPDPNVQQQYFAPPPVQQPESPARPNIIVNVSPAPITPQYGGDDWAQQPEEARAPDVGFSSTPFPQGDSFSTPQSVFSSQFGSGQFQSTPSFANNDARPGPQYGGEEQIFSNDLLTPIPITSRPPSVQADNFSGVSAGRPSQPRPSSSRPQSLAYPSEAGPPPYVVTKPVSRRPQPQVQQASFDAPAAGPRPAFFPAQPSQQVRPSSRPQPQRRPVAYPSEDDTQQDNQQQQNQFVGSTPRPISYPSDDVNQRGYQGNDNLWHSSSTHIASISDQAPLEVITVDKPISNIDEEDLNEDQAAEFKISVQPLFSAASTPPPNFDESSQQLSEGNLEELAPLQRENFDTPKGSQLLKLHLGEFPSQNNWNNPLLKQMKNKPGKKPILNDDQNILRDQWQPQLVDEAQRASHNLPEQQLPQILAIGSNKDLLQLLTTTNLQEKLPLGSRLLLVNLDQGQFSNVFPRTLVVNPNLNINPPRVGRSLPAFAQLIQNPNPNFYYFNNLPQNFRIFRANL